MSSIPTLELDLTETAELVAVPETAGRDGEHPRWTAAMRAAIRQHEERAAHWLATVASHERRCRVEPDDFGDEPTVADHRF